MIDQLLSGLIGALIATILSVVYLHIAENVRLRTDVMLEVLGYTDDIYDRLQRLFVHKDVVYTTGQAGLSPDEYRATSRELATLLKSTKTHAKLAIAYGEGKETGALKELSKRFDEVHGLLMAGTQSTWAGTNSEILDLFKTEIDPLRKKFLRTLIQGTRIPSVAMPTFYRLLLKLKNPAT
jgi:hypothetical protein